MRLSLPRADRLVLPSGATHSVAKPINDVLGLRDDDRYINWLEAEWGSLAPSRATVRKMLGPGKKDDPTAHLRDDLAEIAEEARKQGGAIDYVRLAPHLSRIGHFQAVPSGAESLDVSSLVELAAWGLERSVRGPDAFVECPTCKRPWFARRLAGDPIAAALTPRYCSRPAPGLTVTCAQLEAADRFARERSDWSREYRKVMARRVRGTVSEKDFRAWKSVSNPGKRGEDWIPFDEWKGKDDG